MKIEDYNDKYENHRISVFETTKELAEFLLKTDQNLIDDIFVILGPEYVVHWWTQR